MKITIRILALVSLGLLAASEVQAAWVWTPQTRRWINPKYATKDTPSAQMDWALGFFEDRDYARAAKEFLRLVRAFPRSELAPEAQFLAGVSYEQLDQPGGALAAYKKLIETYPFSARFKDGIEREFAIAESFYSGKPLRILGPFKLPSLDKAIEVYEHVVAQAPYGEYGDQAQFRLAECYRKQQRFEEASRAFQKVIDEYPSSSLTEQAKYNVAFCAHRLSLKPSYDQSATDEAIRWYEQFIATHPGSDLLPEAQESLKQLRGFKAQGLIQVAEFYELQNKPQSAAVYYRQLIENYPKSPQAAQAVARLTELSAKGLGGSADLSGGEQSGALKNQP